MFNSSSSHLGVHLRLIGMAILWGAAWSWGRVIAQQVPPITGSAIRFIIASLTLLIWLYRVDRFKQLRNLSIKQWGGLMAAGSSGIFLYSIFFMLGVQQVPAGKASAIVALNPAITLLFAVWFFKEKLNTLIVLGILLALVGSIYTISQGRPATFFTGEVGAGEYLLLGCVFSWAVYTLINKALVGSIDVLTATALSTLIGAILLCIASLITEGYKAWTIILHASHDVYFSLLGLSFGATVLAFAWFFHGVQRLGASNASAYVSLVPIFGVMISALWLGEPLHRSLLIGTPLAILGLFIMNIGQRK